LGVFLVLSRETLQNPFTDDQNKITIVISDCLKDLRERKRFPRAAGILAIAASLIALAESLLFFWGASQTWVFTHSNYYGWRVLGVSFFYYLATGIFGVISFFFGLASAIFISERKRMKFSIFGLSLLVTCGVIIFLLVFVIGSASLSDVLLVSLFSLPILVPSVLGIVFVTLSKAEFN
jgi:ABC-type multidrug transport system permease subunit